MPSPIRKSLVAAVTVIVLALLAFDVSRRFSLDTSMEHFLPGGQERSLYRISRQVIDSTLTRRMVITVGIADGADSRQARRSRLVDVVQPFSERLSKIEGIRTVTSGPPDGIEEAFFDLYFPRRFAFFSLQPQSDVPREFNDHALDEKAQRLKERLGSPEGVLVRSLAPRDPWLLFARHLESLEKTGLSLDVQDGQFFAREDSLGGPDTDAAIVLVTLDESALDAEAQIPVLRGLSREIERTKNAASFPLVIEMSGANRFAVATQTSMKSDIERVFSLSTVGLIALFLVLFRSARRLLYLVVPIVAGLLVASWVSLLLYGRLHALTLAFGGALIGVAIDYPVHVLAHHDLESPGRSGAATIKRLLPTLGLAAGTTVAGLFGLAWASFPGIREIAIFTGLGVSTALTMTVILGGSVLAESGQAPQAARRLAEALEALLDLLRQRPRVAGALLFAAVLLSVGGLFGVRFAPGLDSLAPLDPTLLAEDERVQRRLGEADSGKLVISTGPDLESALQSSETVAQLLRSTEARTLVEDFTSPALLLRSAALQTRSHLAITGDKSLAARTRAALERADFVPEGFAGLDEELSRPLAPLTFADLQESPIFALVDPFVIDLDGEWAVITPLRGVDDEAALSALLDEVPGASYFSQRTMLNQAYADLRARTTELLLLGLLLVAAVSFARYRNMRRSLAAVLPSVLAAGATVGILAAFGYEVNLLHLLGLLLVCSMGVDYGVFLVDAHAQGRGPALLGITVGCASTMLSFGVLALSSAPALRALGLTIATGIVLSLILAPIALLFVPRTAEEKTS